MRAGRFLRPAKQSLSQCRQYATSANTSRTVPVLPDAEIDTFRQQAFNKASPYLLPRRTFADLPAIEKWFHHASNHPSKIIPVTSQPPDRTTLNRDYFLPLGASPVPLEIVNAGQFCRIDSTISFFLECVQASSSRFIKTPKRYFSSFIPNAKLIRKTTRNNQFFSKRPVASVYLAQAPINDLPRKLRDDLPTPEVVLRAGKGDIYDSSIWLGEAPTYTPLHRDPNPNLLVQLAGQKTVRLMTPEMGYEIFARVKEEIGGSGRATMRGEEMMHGPEKKIFEKMVWDEENEFTARIQQAKLNSGDALFIPKGWWHSVKGVGYGMTGSANWWFR